MAGMNHGVELNLALILFLPWYAILGALYWIYPRAPRTRRRRMFDAIALALATFASAISMYWSFDWADPQLVIPSPGAVKQARALRGGAPVTVAETAGGLLIDLPPRDPHDTVIALELK